MNGFKKILGIIFLLVGGGVAIMNLLSVLLNSKEVFFNGTFDWQDAAHIGYFAGTFFPILIEIGIAVLGYYLIRSVNKH